MPAALQLNQNLFRLLGYMRPSLIPCCPSIICNRIFGGFSAILLYGILAYIWTNSNDLNDAISAVYMVTAMVVCFASHVDVACKKRSVETFFVDFVAVVGERKSVG